MRYAPSTSILPCKFSWATLVAVLLQAALLVVASSTDETTNSRAPEDDLQFEGDLPKRDWNKNLNMWGKRGWSNLHGGWGVKRSVPSWLEQNVYSSPPVVQKRAWRNFQSGWGKRGTAPENDDLSLQDIASMLDQNDQQSITPYFQSDLESHEEKRGNWQKFSDGWGKRTKWENFRGGWGKREPAWVNLKGLWGKRSEYDNFVN